MWLYKDIVFREISNLPSVKRGGVWQDPRVRLVNPFRHALNMSILMAYFSKKIEIFHIFVG